MSDVAADLAVVVTATPAGDGVIIAVANKSGEELRVRFPNPYTGVQLITKSGERELITTASVQLAMKPRLRTARLNLIDLSEYIYFIKKVFIRFCSPLLTI